MRDRTEDDREIRGRIEKEMDDKKHDKGWPAKMMDALEYILVFGSGMMLGFMIFAAIFLRTG